MKNVARSEQAGVIPPGMNTIGKKHGVEFPLRIDPEAGSGESRMTEASP
jgi:hypothetical protein